jgi:DNA repair exonuclease SbcCD ATPase subunit
LNKKCDELVYKNHELNQKTDKLERKRTALRKDLNDCLSILRSVEGDYNSAQNDVNACDRSIMLCVTDIERCEDELAKLRKKENPFTTLIGTAKRYSKELKQDIEALLEQLNKLKVEQEAYAYWVVGFKRVRLFVLEEALHSLEVEVNNLLISLGLVDWKITLDVERENKTGGVTKGFTVFIHSPKFDKPVKYEAWSGGEVQRLRLAGDLGLANLIMEQAGFINYIEIIDEPSAHMSREGIEDMIETIHQRAHDTGRQIWLVDHHTTSFTGFSGVLTAVMDQKGKARLEYEE